MIFILILNTLPLKYKSIYYTAGLGNNELTPPTARPLERICLEQLSPPAAGVGASQLAGPRLPIVPRMKVKGYTLQWKARLNDIGASSEEVPFQRSNSES